MAKVTKKTEAPSTRSISVRLFEDDIKELENRAARSGSHWQTLLRLLVHAAIQHSDLQSELKRPVIT